VLRSVVAQTRRMWRETTPEQVDLLFRGITVSVVVGVIEACVIAVLFVGLVPTAAILGWLAAFLAVRLARLALAGWYRRHRARYSTGYWMRWIMATAALQSLVWGAGAIVLQAPEHLPQEMVLHVVLMGIALSNVSHLAQLFPLLAVYTLGTMVPLVLRDLWIGELHLLLAALSALITIYVLASGYKQAGVHAESNAQRRRNAELIEALREQNAISAEARAQAEQAHAAKVRFFAAASHDLRQPLHALGLYAQAMRAQGTPAEVRGLSAHIADCVDGMAHIVDELLELSRLDAGSIEPRPERVPLARLLHEVAAMHEPAARAKGLALHVALGDAAEAVVFTDAQQARRVLTNLLSNALRYTPRGEVRIEVEVEAEGPGTDAAVRVSVADTGIGVPAEQLPRIFEEFYQVGNEGRDRRHGHGLGLAIVKRLSDLLGLDVRATSAPGQGSRFSIRLPLAAGPMAGLAGLAAGAGDPGAPAESVDAAPDVDPLQGRCVMLVEDDAASRNAMALTLRLWGCDVRAATGTVTACAALGAGWRPAAVIADLRLAGNDDGCRAARSLRGRLGPDLPALLMTGDADGEAAARARAAGFVVLRKPVKPAQLRAYLNEVFAVSGLRATSP